MTIARPLTTNRSGCPQTRTPVGFGGCPWYAFCRRAGSAGDGQLPGAGSGFVRAMATVTAESAASRDSRAASSAANAPTRARSSAAAVPDFRLCGAAHGAAIVEESRFALVFEVFLSHSRRLPKLDVEGSSPFARFSSLAEITWKSRAIVGFFARATFSPEAVRDPPKSRGESSDG